jgi:hypothetical protein
LKEYKKIIEAVYVYGSAVSENNANDIDTIIILNDSSEIKPFIIDKIEQTCGIIEDRARKDNLIFHFQPLKMLSRWWYLVLEGEPWILNSLKEIIIVYDKKGIIEEVSKLIKNENVYKKEERAEKLIERSDTYLFKNRQSLLNSLTTLSEAATEAAQILLLFDNKFILNKKRIIEELEKNYTKKISIEMIGNYKEIVDLEEKMERGSLSEFSAENLDYYLDKVKKFIFKVENMLAKK